MKDQKVKKAMTQDETESRETQKGLQGLFPIFNEKFSLRAFSGCQTFLFFFFFSFVSFVSSYDFIVKFCRLPSTKTVSEVASSMDRCTVVVVGVVEPFRRSPPAVVGR